MHGISRKQLSEGSNRGLKACPELREGLAEGTVGGNQMRRLFWARKRPLARLSWVHDAAIPVRAHLCRLAGEFLRPRGADPGRSPAADQAEPGARHPARARSGPAFDA